MKAEPNNKGGEAEAEVDVFITDLNGCARGKRMPLSSISKIQKEGMKLPMSSVAEDIWGTDTPDSGLVFETGDNDGVCHPIQKEPLPLTWRDSKHYLMMCSMSYENGSPFLLDSRQLLKAIVAQYKKLKFSVVVATELEFYLIDRLSASKQKPKPPKIANQAMTETQGYSIEVLDELDGFLNDVRKGCVELGIPADTIISEIGPGQFEINLRHMDDPLFVADKTILFKRLVKGVAKKHDMLASFMAKPYGGESGNGFHVHFSVLDEGGHNIFDDGTHKGSKVLRHALGGLLQTMSDSMLIFAPHLNSYRRFQKGAHAPTYGCWGYENRTVALRVPESEGHARRIEHRVSGADANPYLVLASVLAGALHGIHNKIKPNKPVSGNAYEVFNSKHALPLSWESAIDQFEHSENLKTLFGEQFVGVFSAIKLQELRVMQSRVTDVEYDSYLNVF